MQHQSSLPLPSTQRFRGEERLQGGGQVSAGLGGLAGDRRQGIRLRQCVPARRHPGEGVRDDGQGDRGRRALRLQWNHIRLRTDLLGQDAHDGGRAGRRQFTRHYTAHCSGHFHTHLLDGLQSRVSDQGLLFRDLFGQD